MNQPLIETDSEREAREAREAAEARDTITQLIADNQIVLFMKGSRLFPQCGFSGAVVDVLKRHGVTFKTFNVLRDPAVREGIKVFSEWPTIPQLYVAGEFIGGCDIVKEMDENGELATLLKTDQAPAS